VSYLSSNHDVHFRMRGEYIPICGTLLIHPKVAKRPEDATCMICSDMLHAWKARGFEFVDDPAERERLLRDSVPA
jgi:hypothetical protein